MHGTIVQTIPNKSKLRTSKSSTQTPDTMVEYGHCAPQPYKASYNKRFATRPKSVTLMGMLSYEPGFIGVRN